MDRSTNSDAVPALVERWLARLQSNAPDHERFVGAPLSIEGLAPLDLGRLWAPMRRAHWGSTASNPAMQAAIALQNQARAAGLLPAFDAPAGLEVLRTVANKAWAEAVSVLGQLVCEPTPAMRHEVNRVLGPREDWPADHGFALYQACALARHADVDRVPDLREHALQIYSDSPHQRAEFELLLQISVPALLVLAGSRNSYYWPDEAEGGDDPAAVLASEPACAAFARETLEAALQRVEDIHAGSVAYQADGAFSVQDAHVIARAARIAAWRDEPWYRGVVARLLPLACVAPTAAKTAPSQALAVALGHSTEGVPTPEGVQALRAALAVVRHAGLKKKLSRNLKPAERALAARPEVALRMSTASTKPDRKLQAMLATCLEAGWWQGLRWSDTQWLEQIAAPPNGVPFACGLVWVAEHVDGAQRSFVMRSGAAPSFVDARSQALAWQRDARIRLWHPLDADHEQRRDWQAFFVQQRVRQPLRQAFREIYRSADDQAKLLASNEFAGHELSIRPLIGLARREGWRVAKYEGLVRTFGATRVNFQVGAELYPGLEGGCESMALRFERAEGRVWKPMPIGTVDPIVYSEACRAVDLLVSVTTFAVEDGSSALPITAGDLGLHLAGTAAPAGTPAHPRVARMRRLDHLATLPLSGMATMRRVTLQHVFAAQIEAGRVVVDERHVRVGRCAVHLATARVTRDGEALELPAAPAQGKLAALPWLPYDEALLQRVAEAVGTLLGPDAAQLQAG